MGPSPPVWIGKEPGPWLLQVPLLYLLVREGWCRQLCVVTHIYIYVVTCLSHIIAWRHLILHPVGLDLFTLQIGDHLQTLCYTTMTMNAIEGARPLRRSIVKCPPAVPLWPAAPPLPSWSQHPGGLISKESVFHVFNWSTPSVTDKWNITNKMYYHYDCYWNCYFHCCSVQLHFVPLHFSLKKKKKSRQPKLLQEIFPKYPLHAP